MLASDVGEGVEDVLRGERQRQPGARVARRDAGLRTQSVHHNAKIQPLQRTQLIHNLQRSQLFIMYNYHIIQ